MLRCRPLDVADVSFCHFAVPEPLLSALVERHLGVQGLLVLLEGTPQRLSDLVGHEPILIDDLHVGLLSRRLVIHTNFVSHVYIRKG